MSFFQESIKKKYLNELDNILLDNKYKQFCEYFHNKEIQRNIRKSKEEQFQEGFLRELFVNIFEYTLNPQPEFNLTTELKNIANSKKVDGAILKNGDAIAVIELKGIDTNDLEKVESQAFGYKSHNPKCIYVITSNFEKIRFYIQNAVEHINFNLFDMSREQFALMWLCLAKDNLLNDIPLKMKESSLMQEENITKKLYVDYSKFRETIYTNLVKNNPELDKLLLFKKTQKLLDRFLFVFFAEDRLLIPPNSIREIINQWKILKEELDEYMPLYARFKKFFGYLNTGYKGKNYEIFAYNGGLFAPDEILDNISIDDNILFEHTAKLSQYDFDTEVDVNILGHIFEHSLGEIESVQAEIANTTREQVTIANTTKEHAPLFQQHHQPHIILTTMEHAPLLQQSGSRRISKRKKDGIFYTPKYITKYIVENTIGKLCTEKRAEFGIIDEDYSKGRKNRKKEEIMAHDKKLTDYRNWLLNITILDPACGSGAFLNQALDFLINEHQKIDNLRAQLLEEGLVFANITSDILEKNIYGVDINEESVEIAKLSLWLRTAQIGRKLNSLSNNIKCGNSLIDDPAVAGDKAFNWEKEFPQVFKEKDLKAFHITIVTHNSRYSQRMFENHVKRGEPVWLTEQEEIIVSETFNEIITSDKIKILAYNICGDHLHFLMVCESHKVAKIVQKIKSMTARACNIAMGRTIPATTMEHAPLQKIHTSIEHSPSLQRTEPRGTTQYHLWAQKYSSTEVRSDEQLVNTIEYIRNNRIKHGLPEHNNGACSIVATNTIEDAFKPQFTGGFDVVIGNPPYVQLQTMGEMSDILSRSGYETYDKGADVYCLFTERGYKLLRNGGVQSFIMPNKWMLVNYGKPLRKFLSKTGLQQILNFGDVQFFQEAATIVCIFVTQKANPNDNVKVLSINRKTYKGDFISEVDTNIYDYPTSKFGEAEWSIQPYQDAIKLEKMKKNSIELKDLPISIYRGILTGFNEAFYINEEKRKQLIDADPKSVELIKPMVRGRDITTYGITDFEYLIATFPILKLDIEEYPAIKQHLLSFGFERLIQTGDNGSRKKTNGKWFETQDSIGYYQEFAKPKIIYPNMTSIFPFMYDESGLLGNDKIFILTANDDSVSLPFLTAVFNSSLVKLWIWYNCPELLGGTREIRKVYFEHLPIPKANKDDIDKIAELAKIRTGLTFDLQNVTSKFKRNLQREFNFAKLTNKIENWLDIPFNEFIKELLKNKIKLTLYQKSEWEEYFLLQVKQAQEIKTIITQTDKKIDQLVYQIYGFTEEEIRVVV